MSDSEVSAYASAFSEFIFSNRTVVYMIAIYLYDICLTFGDEVNTIWMPKWNITTAIYLLNRYIFMVSLVFDGIISLAWNLSSPQCATFCNIADTASVAATFMGSLLLALRVAAIYRWSWPIMVFLAVILAGRIVIGTLRDFPFVVNMTAGPSFPGCVGTTGNPYIVAQLVDTILIVIFDTFVFAMTVRQTLGQVLAARRMGLDLRISFVLFRDGILYFFILFFANCLNAVFTVILWRNPNGINPKGFDLFSALVEVLQPLLVSRLMLNIKFAAHHEEHMTGHTISSFGVQNQPVNASRLDQIVGDIGGPLVTRHPEDEVGEDFANIDAHIDSDRDKPKESSGPDINSAVLQI